jgi:hypothetical protein
VIVQGEHVGARGHVPHAHRGITAPAHDHVAVVLETEHAARVTAHCLHALARILVPDLDGVVAQAAHNFCVVVLQAVDALAVLRAAVDLLDHALSLDPVTVHLLLEKTQKKKKFNRGHFGIIIFFVNYLH